MAGGRRMKERGPHERRWRRKKVKSKRASPERGPLLSLLSNKGHNLLNAVGLAGEGERKREVESVHAQQVYGRKAFSHAVGPNVTVGCMIA
jgi:hypothetical protein